MLEQNENIVSKTLEQIVLQHDSRGMQSLSKTLPEGYCARAAKKIFETTGTILIATGFYVAGTFETDGPLAAITLYNTLKQLGREVFFICSPLMSEALKNYYSVITFPILDDENSIEFAKNIVKDYDPTLLITIEHAGPAHDNHCYNMRGECITAHTPKIHHLFNINKASTLCFGDGGNELGMGNVLETLQALPIKACVVPCDELVVATVSDWGVYAVIAMLGYLTKQNFLATATIEDTMDYLLQQGAIDGITKNAEKTVDTFPLTTIKNIIYQLQQTTEQSSN